MNGYLETRVTVRPLSYSFNVPNRTRPMIILYPIPRIFLQDHLPVKWDKRLKTGLQTTELTETWKWLLKNQNMVYEDEYTVPFTQDTLNRIAFLFLFALIVSVLFSFFTFIYLRSFVSTLFLNLSHKCDSFPPGTNVFPPLWCKISQIYFVVQLIPVFKWSDLLLFHFKRKSRVTKI